MALFKSKPQEQQPQASVLIAAASNLRVATYRDALLVTLQRQPWQYRALDMYEDEGHAHYATSYIGNAMSRIRLVAAKKAVDPREPPTEVTSGPVYEAVQQLASGRGGQKGMLRLLGTHLFLVGECWLVGTLLPTGMPRWDVLSIQELTVMPGDPLSLYRKRLPGATPEPIPSDALVMRIWREHPRYSELADSSFRPLLDLLEKILLLNRAEKAAARSRSASMGLLGIPQELIPPPQQNQETTSDPTAANPFFAQFTQAMLAPLSDEGHPGSVVPIILVGPGDMVNKIKFEPMNRPFEASIRQSIQDAIEQVAHGLEIPVEILTGVGKASRLTAWQIKEDTFQAHIQPLIELICDALTIAYLRPAIERARAVLLAAGESEDDLDSYVIWYDSRELVIRPDKGDKAVALHDRFAISNAALRRENGFLESDTPSDKEYAKRVGIKLLDVHMAIDGKTPPDQAKMMQTQADIQTEQQIKMAKEQAKIQDAQMEKQAELQAQQPPPGGDAANPPEAPAPGAGAKIQVTLPSRTGRPKESSQPDSFHTPQGKRSKPRPQAESRRKKPAGPPPSPVDPSLTAAGAERHLVSKTFSHKLGMIDVRLLRLVQKHANDAVAHALQVYAITAGASAQDLVGNDATQKANEAAVEAAFYDSYDEAMEDLSDELEAQGLSRLAPEIAGVAIVAAVTAAMSRYRDAVFGLINDRLFQAVTDPTTEEFLVRPGDVRNILEVAGGGGASADLSMYNGGVSTGAIMQGVLRDQGVPIDGTIWLYDPGVIREPFQGHRQLDGLVFQRWDDPELAVYPEDSWIRSGFYFPGDHRGCACVAAPWTGEDWGEGHLVEV